MRNASKTFVGTAAAVMLMSTLGMGCMKKQTEVETQSIQRADASAARAEAAASRAEAAAGRVEDAARRAEAAAQKAEAIFMKHMRK
jgi:nucleoid-associated protein YgaU